MAYAVDILSYTHFARQFQHHSDCSVDFSFYNTCPEQACDGPTLEEWRLLEDLYWEELGEAEAAIRPGSERNPITYMSTPDDDQGYL